MKNKTLLAALVAAILVNGACSAPAPANSNAATTNTTANTNRAASTANNSSASNTGQTNSTTNSASNSGSSTAQGNQDFTLVNSTGVEINSVYVSPHDSNDWEEDILGQDTLASGQSVDIKFEREEKAAMWDLRVEDKSGNSIEWENLNLLQISKVTLHYKDGKATAETE